MVVNGFVPSWICGLMMSLTLACANQVCVAEEVASETDPEIDVAVGAGATRDDEFLRETARTLGLDVPEDRLDHQILSWGGLRPQLEEAGITFEGSLIIDYSKNLAGGLDTAGGAFRHLLDMRLNFDTEALVGWHGGTLSIDFQNQHGRNATDHLVGDIQGFNNADADGRTQVSELWYEQLLFDDVLRIKIGKVDANSEFAFPEYGGEFINSSYGFSPTIVGLPTYPDPAVSVNVFVYPTDWLYAGFGAYDGSGAHGVLTGSYGPGKVFDDGAEAFLISEVGVRWALDHDTLPGRFAVGGHYHTADFERFDGTTQSGVAGFYLILEQKLWHDNPDNAEGEQGLYGFIQYAHTNERVSEIADHFGGGLVWVAPYEKENPDSLGIGFTWVGLTDETGAGFTRDSETAIEAFYNFQATSYLSIKPDLQYIIHPGGDRATDNALVFTLRVTLAF